MKIVNKLIGILFIAFVFVAFNGCKTTQQSTTKSTNTDTLSYEQRFEFKYQFYKANQFSLEEKNSLSLSLFNECLKIDPYSSASHYKVASIYLKMNDITMAEKHAELAVLYNPTNIWYLYLEASIYSMNNKTDKAKIAFSKLIDMNPNEMEFYFSLADVYLKSGDYEGSIKISNQIEDKFGITESISLQKHKLYLAQNKSKDALKELNNLSNAFPSNIVYKRYIADFYMQSKSVDEAIISYKDILEDYPNDGLSHIGLSDCYRAKGQYTESIDHIKLAFLSTDLPSDFKFNVLVTLLQNVESNPQLKQDTYILSQSLYKQYPSNTDIVTIYANFKLQNNQLDTARVLLIDVIEVRKDKYAIWEQLVLLDNEFSDWNGMFSHSTEALKYFPNQSFLYFFQGFSAFQLKDFNSAINSFSFGLKLVTSKDPLKFDFMSYLAESYYQSGQKEVAYISFDKLLDLDPENIMVLNNSAY